MGVKQGKRQEVTGEGSPGAQVGSPGQAFHRQSSEGDGGRGEGLGAHQVRLHFWPGGLAARQLDWPCSQEGRN